MRPIFSIFKIWVFAASLAFQLTGCVAMQVQREEELRPVASTATIAQHNLVFGFLPPRRINEQDLCPNSQIETLKLQMRGVDVLLSLVTLGVYVTQQIEYSCGALGSR